MEYGPLVIWLDLSSCSFTLLPFKSQQWLRTKNNRIESCTWWAGDVEHFNTPLNPSPTEGLFGSQHNEMSIMWLCSIEHNSFHNFGFVERKVPWDSRPWMMLWSSVFGSNVDQKMLGKSVLSSVLPQLVNFNFQTRNSIPLYYWGISALPSTEQCRETQKNEQ